MIKQIMKIANIFNNVSFESRGIKFVESFEENGIEVVPFLRKEKEGYIKFSFRTARQILKQNIKLIHAHRISGFIPAIMAKIFRPSIKIIYDKHDIHKYDFIFDRLLFFANYTLVASELHLDYIKKFTKKCEIIPNYSDFKPISEKRKEEIRNEIGLKEDEVMVLFQGSIVRDYGLDLLIKALPLINKKVKLVILGWIKEPEYWEEIKRDLTDRVIYLGSKKYSDMNDYVGAADVGVVLFKKSRLTLFGNPAKLFEFINCKVPVVATDIECVSKYIRKYGNGLVVDDEKALATAINKLSNKQTREGYSRKSPYLQFSEEFKEKYTLILKEFEK